MQFVNIHGEAVSTTTVERRKASSRKASPDAYHKGWRVVGFSPEHIAQGELDHATASKAAVSAGRSPLSPFDASLYMLQVRPKKARPKPFEIYSAALQFKDMLEKAGWRGVEVVPVAKGQA